MKIKKIVKQDTNDLDALSERFQSELMDVWHKLSKPHKTMIEIKQSGEEGKKAYLKLVVAFNNLSSALLDTVGLSEKIQSKK